MKMRLFLILGASALCLLSSAIVRAQSPTPATTTAESASPDTEGMDAATATKAWLDSVPADKRAKSDAYFEGGYWMILWEYLLSAAIMVVLLKSGLSVRMRDFAEKTTGSKILQTLLYAVPFILIVMVISFPLTFYETFVRDHAYGLSTQSFGGWLKDQIVGQAIPSFIVASIFLVVLFGVFRRAPRTWWIWAVLVITCFALFVSLVYPVYIAPLTNKYQPLRDATIRDPILQMARANEIPVDNVYEFDASRQTNRVSANVAGFLGTTRIALNDNLLKQCTLPEIRMVMAHEMGHYVLNHGTKLTLYMAVLNFISLGLLFILFNAAIRKWGAKWNLRGIADPAAFPLVVLIYATISFLGTPFNNSAVRITEREADAFGINTSREADGMAKVALKLGTYRKLNPGPLEEMIFFDHPSGRARIRMAMDWKAAHLPAGDVK
jgi:STE24 endopeptidase